MKNSLQTSIFAALLISLISGCAQVISWNPQNTDHQISATEKITPEIENFEQKREHAQYLAAINRAESNDLVGYEQELNQLLEKNSNHIAAQLRLAELRLWQEKPDEALVIMNKVIHDQPKNSEALHILALVYEALDRNVEAISTIGLAINNSPQNMEEFYQMELERLSDLAAEFNEKSPQQ